MAKDCSNVLTIQDVNDLWDYKDEHGGGKHDSKFVSCGQDEKSSGYSELKNKFDKHFDGITNQKWLSKSMCKCCNELKPNGTEKVTWLEFYKCLKSKIIGKNEKTLIKINKLIKWHEDRETK